MDSDTLCSIGELARRTGMTVKTVRYYSDQGIVPPTERSAAGYRLYGPDAPARLALVRTLRELGVGLAAVRRVLDRDVSVPDVAEAHADALDVQIRALRLRRAVLRAVAARRSPTTMEMDLMHRFAKLSRAEQRRLVADFVEDALQGLDDANPEFVALMRSALPELPDDPAPERLEAWVELAGLCQDAGFRAAVRGMAEGQAREPAQEGVGGLQDGLNRAMLERIEEAVALGVLPGDVNAGPLGDWLGGLYGDAFERVGGGDLRRWLLARLRMGDDARAERYWGLLATVNGWPVSPALAPVHTWFTAVAAAP
jgi:DNA-binding transcriptional MerR regulator